ncbi:MAG: hypothetical protein IKM20_07315 [Erysipelotrichales bacterium]|nr:hypothetical protein [Erysipelotrichales bacterium]
MKTCGYACIKKLLSEKGININFKEFNFNNKEALSFADFQAICNYYKIDGKGYYMEFDDVPNNSIMHLEIDAFKHYIYLVRKGMFCIYYDNHGFHIIYRGILKKLYSKHTFIVI